MQATICNDHYHTALQMLHIQYCDVVQPTPLLQEHTNDNGTNLNMLKVGQRNDGQKEMSTNKENIGWK